MTTTKPTAVVVAGGLSHEREISLRSGRRVAEELRTRGLTVVESDVQNELLGQLRTIDNPVVVPMLHGGAGEDGAVREVFDLVGVACVGSSAAACRVSYDKALAIPAVAAQGVRVPKRVVLPQDMFRDLGADALMLLIEEKLGLPMFVKPSASGSALGCTRVDALSELAGAMVRAYSYGPVAIVEEFIEGTEVAVPVVELGGVTTAYPPVEIRPLSGVYDFQARYIAGATEFVCPADLPDETLDACKRVAQLAHTTLALTDLSRADIIVTKQGEPVFIETSVAPGMGETSLFPLAIETADGDFAEVLEALVVQAAVRHAGK